MSFMQIVDGGAGVRKSLLWKHISPSTHSRLKPLCALSLFSLDVNLGKICVVRTTILHLLVFYACFLKQSTLTQLSQLGGQIAISKILFPHNASIMPQMVSNPAW